MNRLRLSVLFSSTLLLCACISAPHYQEPPAVQMPKQWTLSEKDNEPAEALDQWWQNFHDPVLDRLISEGLANNHDIRHAVLKIEEARAVLAGTRSGFWPTADAEGRSTRSRNSDSVSLPNQHYQTRNYVGTAITWEIDLFGRVRNSVAADTARYEQLQEDADAIRLSVASEIVRSYFDMRSAQAQLQAQESILGALRGTRKIVLRRVQAGDLAQIELQNIDARLLSAQAAIPEIQARIRAEALALSILTGGQPNKELFLVSTAIPIRSLPAIPAGSPADILRRRPDIRAAERQLAASNAEVGVAVAAQFPQLTINANGGFDALSPVKLVRSSNESWSVFPFISWRVMDGGKIRAEIHAAQARQKIAAVDYEQTVLKALNESETAMSNYHYYQQSVAQWTEAAVQAQQVFRSQQRRFSAGDISMADVLEAQRQYAEAQYSLALVQGKASSAMVDVVKALGGGI
ncbi:hypothetical protein BHC43_06885 [Snodgrassella alvi]|uniref:efflux transporter outer membrane subunit n=1 Tax=Snodgrassella alvi TaxID=1196083 RepID=UPI000C1E2E82|nr:efflux transporter outer membrane subunit [Snodgrassella alvi]PIT37597.1 hypothetical protein BHC43_06885 [Snodgrassella alvi]